MTKSIGLIIGHLTYGGAERQIVELAKGLKEAGRYRPVVICYTPFIDPFGFELQKESIDFIYLHKSANPITKLAWIRHSLLKFDCDIAYSFLNPSNIYTWLACNGIRTKYIASVRGTPDLSGLLRIGLSLSAPKADAIVANSQSGKDWIIREYNIQPEKVWIIPNAIYNPKPNFDKIEEIQKILGINSSDRIIGVVARLDQQKNPIFFLKICEYFISNYRDSVHFVWVGDGPLKTEIENMISKLPENIQAHIHIVGAKNNIADWYALFDLFTLVSQWEGLSNALMEAMALGLPCLCTNAPGINELIQNGETGILVDQDVEKYCQCLDLLLSDPEYANTLGRKASAYVLASFSRKQLAEKTTMLFERING